jgi:hypothetical protein
MANEADIAHLYGIILPPWVWLPESTSKSRILDSELVTESFAIVHRELAARERNPGD